MTPPSADVTQAKKAALRMLAESDIRHAPVDVLALAESRGIRVVYEELEDKVSGMLVQTADETVIGINARHHVNRQRFTLAHELAHYVLHAPSPTVYVDGMMVHFRSDSLFPPAKPIEIEANAFAATLLMPPELLRRDLAGRTIDAFDESPVRRLAQQYGVSPQALTIRLLELGYMGGVADMTTTLAPPAPPASSASASGSSR
jgi:Zn-dependent peptidase ImmA (M78 family)